MSEHDIIVALGAFITSLFGVIGYLWRLHLKDDEARDADLKLAKTAGATAVQNAADLVPSVTQLTNAVKLIDERAEERYTKIQSQSDAQHKVLLRKLERIGKRSAS